MLERKLFGKIGAIPETVCDRGEKTPDRLGRENLPPSPFGLWRDKPGDGVFALGLCCRRRYSPPRGCADSSASPKAKIPSRSTLPNFQIGAMKIDPLHLIDWRELWVGLLTFNLQSLLVQYLRQCLLSVLDLLFRHPDHPVHPVSI